MVGKKGQGYFSLIGNFLEILFGIIPFGVKTTSPMSNEKEDLEKMRKVEIVFRLFCFSE